MDITGYVYIYIRMYTYGQLGDMALFENGGLTPQLRLFCRETDDKPPDKIWYIPYLRQLHIEYMSDQQD